MSQAWSDLEKAMKLLEEIPDPIRYIVLDHAHPPGARPREGRDAAGRKYVVASPSIRDALQTHGSGEAASPGHIPIGQWGVPVYLRGDLPTGWPNSVGREF
jgi:hypothetical protein